MREPEYRSACAQPSFPFQRPLQSLEAACCRCSGPLEKETRGVSPTGAVVVWMVSHLSHYFHIKRRGYVRESIVPFECVFKPEAAKRVLVYRGPFLALPPDPWEDPFSLHCYYGYFGRKMLKVLLYGMIDFSSINVTGVNCISPAKFVSIVFLFCFLGF